MTFFTCARPGRGAFLAVALAGASPATAATEEAQAWITESFAFKASKTDTITLDLGQRARSDASGGEQFLSRIALDHAITPHLQIGGGLAYFQSEAERELRLFQQVTATHGLWLSRTRLEQRFFDDADRASWRLRQRAQIAIPIDDARKWSLVAGTELFFHLNRARPNDRTGFAMMRNQLAVRHAVTQALDVQLLYMRQQSFRDARPDAVAHIPWLTLSWRM